MKKLSRMISPALSLILLFSMALPASALFWNKAEGETAAVASFAKNGLVNQSVAFQQSDFVSQVQGDDALKRIVVTKLPDGTDGILKLGGANVPPGATIDMDQIGTLRFYPLAGTGAHTAAFSFLPVFSGGTGKEAVVSIHLLKTQNNAPVAENLSLSTYKNIAISGAFSAIDPEGDTIAYQLKGKPARGEVTFHENSASFVYTPYENKTGKDSFTYVAVDKLGNVSKAATVKVVIEKPVTKVTYADMQGHPAHRAAIKLAETNLLVGECLNGQYFFHPDEAVTRSEFLASAMNAAGLPSLSNVSITGFADDSQIPAWAKDYAATALKAGIIQGEKGSGGTVFSPNDDITAAEAAVILNRVLDISDVSSTASFSSSQTSLNAWANQAAVNLSAHGILTAGCSSSKSLSQHVTRADMAEMLCSALELLEARQGGGLFHW
ncbi:MAG: Ig-like domain-containing protein [Oscillospiraceae bacterium]|nr:Ig-like domain-containing protein [Oscillospiraceae bacterium]